MFHKYVHTSKKITNSKQILMRIYCEKGIFNKLTLVNRQLRQAYSLSMHRDQSTDAVTLNAYTIATGTHNSAVPLVSQAVVSTTKLLK